MTKKAITPVKKPDTKKAKQKPATIVKTPPKSKASKLKDELQKTIADVMTS